EITRAILTGRQAGARRDVVLLNAAAALVAAGKADSLAMGIKLAGDSIDSGAAMSVLRRFIEFTQSVSKA
ncbi:MAG TPA: anthranilate phosphoribosyltransferase, partial [Anaerolineae bacterium]|nr:anthranilate phosphoribosyltransferase [Anaerolineae bacterium]